MPLSTYTSIARMTCLSIAVATSLALVQACNKASDNEGKNPAAYAKLDKLENAAKKDANSKPTESSGNQVTTETGLQYEDLKVGDGDNPKLGDLVVVHYTGWLLDGTKFDSSVDRGKPFKFPIGKGNVIKGWDEGVMTMKVGGKRKLTIPANLAYGDRGAGSRIPPGATLVFEVELLGLE